MVRFVAGAGAGDAGGALDGARMERLREIVVRLVKRKLEGGAAGAVSFKRLGRFQIALSRIANFAISLRAERPRV